MPLRYRDTSTKAQHPIRLVLSANPDPNNNDNISHNSKHCWPCDCVDGAAKERTAQAYPCVSDHKIDQFHSQIQQVLMARGSTTFSKIVNK
ncbi:hypothetical protein PSTG_16935 [Puccinia striiformis f. sp. tritici PST-78]|uniref:Uncharacterized protein n=1 Tax=Puccinia striiformis f. sp. tritici PST-78 TaxID=1165861 RepID=A0A0L0URT5_9BASI|nr:hypothetical protein PSTG_16935 [Puccinia striiformis f. sp. tritici PST-78]